MNAELKDYGKSVRAKLLNVAKANGMYYQTILTRFFHERLLFRLSQTPYRNNFFLKGGALMYAYEHFAARPTLDIDFLGTGINNEGEAIAQAFRQICSISCEEDGVWFDTERIAFRRITELREYPGIRLSIPVRMDTIVQTLTMDVGFGDTITPAPVDTDYPLLLENLPGVRIKAYSIESIIAEKAHAIIDLAEENSRLKDYYDLYVIFSSVKFNPDILAEAIRSTFKNRHTVYDKDTMFFRPSFPDSKKMQIKWLAFTKRINSKQNMNFRELALYLQEKLLPYWK